MNAVEELRYILIEKFKNNAGLQDSWAYNAAQRVIELIDEGYDLESAVKEVYRRL